MMMMCNILLLILLLILFLLFLSFFSFSFFFLFLPLLIVTTAPPGRGWPIRKSDQREKRRGREDDRGGDE